VIRRWRVYAGDRAVLEVTDAPGALISTAPPHGSRPVMHPFLSAAALDAGHEDRLRGLLESAGDLDGFLHALAAAGYRVEPGAA